MTTSAWPFETDADRHDPLTTHRIAVASPWASWCYIVSFDRDSPERPTDAEALMLASFLREYIEYWYSDSYKAKLAARDLDVDGSANGICFRKYGTDDWGYRRRSWEYGPTFVPSPPSVRAKNGSEPPLGPLSLAQVMDRIHSIGGDGPMPRWVKWKTQHPHVFPA